MRTTIDPNREGWIYYALSATPTEQLVKIGFTVNMRGRMMGLRHQAPAPGRQTPIVLAVEAGTLLDEAKRHALWADYRVRGEWFRYEDALRLHIASLPALVEEAFELSRPAAREHRNSGSAETASDEKDVRPWVDRIKAADAEIAAIQEEIAEAQRIRDGDIKMMDAEFGATETARRIGCSRSTVLLIRGRDTSEPRKPRARKDTR